METSLRTMVHKERSTNGPDAIMLRRSAQGLANLVNGYRYSVFSSRSVSVFRKAKRSDSACGNSGVIVSGTVFFLFWVVQFGSVDAVYVRI